MVIFTGCEKIQLKDGTEYVVDEFKRLWKREGTAWRLNIRHSAASLAAYDEERGHLQMDGEAARLYFILSTNRGYL